MWKMSKQVTGKTGARENTLIGKCGRVRRPIKQFSENIFARWRHAMSVMIGTRTKWRKKNLTPRHERDIREYYEVRESH